MFWLAMSPSMTWSDELYVSHSCRCFSVCTRMCSLSALAFIATTASSSQTFFSRSKNC